MIVEEVGRSLIKALEFLLLAITSIVTAISLTNAVRVNMQGSVSLGDEVMDTIAHYLLDDQLGARRSIHASHRRQSFDRNKVLLFCENIKECNGKVSFINDYVVSLANGVESVLHSHFLPTKDNLNKAFPIIREQLQPLLVNIRNLVKSNDETSENTLKIISAKFQDMSLKFMKQRYGNESPDLEHKIKIPMQHLIAAIMPVEIRYEIKTCYKYNLCDRELGFTKAIDTFLELLRRLPDDKVNLFIEYFRETLPENFFKILLKETSKQFLDMLIRMSNGGSSTKGILLAVQHAVQVRLSRSEANIMDPNEDITTTKYDHEIFNNTSDVQLIHVILSDLDHLYSTLYRFDTFDHFFTVFRKWKRHAHGDIHTELNLLMKDIQIRLDDQPEELKNKLSNEVKVFLELTVE